MTKIYTRQGDSGRTGYLGKGRISKSDGRIETLGAIDEANSALGMVLSHPGRSDELESLLARTQHVLFEAGATVASESLGARDALFREEVKWLEDWIDRIDPQLEPLTQFILPGGAPRGASLHWARTVCRHAERVVVGAFGESGDHAQLLAYLNRLSDALFVAARWVNRKDGAAETKWVSTSKEDETGKK